MEKVEFTEIYGDGVMLNFQPSEHIYFDWHRSPIPAQFRFIYEIARKMKYYKYLENLEDTSAIDKYKLTPVMNVFDF